LCGCGQGNTVSGGQAGRDRDRDHVIDLGLAGAAAAPSASRHRRGAPSERTVTGRHLDDRAALKERSDTTGTLEIRGATAHNLRDSMSIRSEFWSSSPASLARKSSVHGSIPADAGGSTDRA